MLGCVAKIRPQCTSYIAGACTTLRVVNERMKQMSSTCRATLGNSSDTGSPLSPWRLNFHGAPRIGSVPSVNCPPTCPKLLGIGCPASRSSSGFGSKLSIELGAPTLKMKITDFARAGKCGGFGARGFTAGRARPSRASKCCNASAPKPFAAPLRTSRRRSASRRLGLRSVNKLIAVQQGQREIRQPRLPVSQELFGQLRFFGAWLPRQRKQIGLLGLASAVVAAGGR